MCRKGKFGTGKRHKRGGLRQKSVKMYGWKGIIRNIRVWDGIIREIKCLGRNNQEYKVFGTE